MKRNKNTEKLVLKTETVRSLQKIQPLDDGQLAAVVGGTGIARTPTSQCTNCQTNL